MSNLFTLILQDRYVAAIVGISVIVLYAVKLWNEELWRRHEYDMKKRKIEHEIRVAKMTNRATCEEIEGYGGS